MTPIAVQRARVVLDGDLRVDLDGRAMRLHGTGRSLVLAVDSVADLRAVSAGLGEDADLRAFASLLEQLGLSLEVATRRGVLGAIGVDAADTVTARLVGAPVRTGPLVDRALRGGVAVVVAVAVLVVARRWRHRR